MKKLFYFMVFQLIITISLKAQPVSGYTYKLDNGIIVKSEQCWNQVWVQQEYSDLKAGDQNPLSVNIRTLGELTAGSSFKLLKNGKEVKTLGAEPGTYDMKLVFKLAGKGGSLSFVAGNVIIKPKTKTKVSITLYDYQVNVSEAKASLNGSSSFETKVQRFKGCTDLTIVEGLPVFYEKGKHDKSIAPDQSTSKTAGKIKPGVYDLLVSTGPSGKTQKIWLENFTMKPDMNYIISTNFNAGIILYAGGNKDVKGMRIYPAGTAARQTSPAPIKNLELGSYDNVNFSNPCPPGAYDVLLSFSKEKYEWRKNLVIKTGSRTEVR
jgi:hypothetical protein